MHSPKINLQYPYKYYLLLAFVFFIYSFLLVNAQDQAVGSGKLGEEINQLRKEINKKQTLIQELEKEALKYKKEIAKKQKEHINLKNQISVIDNRLAKINIDTSVNEVEIDRTLLEIDKLKLEINDKEEEIANIKKRIVKTIRYVYKLRNTSYLEIVMRSNSLTDFFDQIKHLSNINQHFVKMAKKAEILKGLLTISQNDLQKKRVALIDLQKKLIKNKTSLDINKSTKVQLLQVTMASEKKFQQLISQIKEEYRQIDEEIKNLEIQMRRKLEEQKVLLGQAVILWPVNYPYGNTVITKFHDPDYPFRYIFEHPGLDIRSPQGSYVKASSTGYVLKVKNGGRYGYSYITILHSNDLSTLYGHVVKIFVKEGELVKSGDIIALSGGLPGTPGAGRLSTGPHMHFEVRLNGVPVDPMKYLP